jgi:hypothetical protein
MPDRRLLEHKAFAAEVRHRLNEWEVADWLRLRDEQRARRLSAPPAAQRSKGLAPTERVAGPAPRRAAPAGPMLYRDGGRILYIG